METRGSHFYLTPWFPILFIYLAIQQILSTYYGPDSVLGAGTIMGIGSDNMPAVVLGVERL